MRDEPIQYQYHENRGRNSGANTISASKWEIEIGLSHHPADLN